MSDEIDDSEFFQQDFTTASEWEIFNARLEELFHEWRLPYVELGRPLQKHELSICEWTKTIETLHFADAELIVTRYTANISNDGNDLLPPISDPTKSKLTKCQAFEDLMSIGNDYCLVTENSEQDVHPLVRWYGLRDFVVLRPTKAISNESQIRILMSSIHVAMAESNSEVPIFVQVLDKKQNVFLGVCENQSTRLSFDIVHLHNTPVACKYLSGLLDMFKGKIGIQYVDPVIVSVRLAYNLTKFYTSAYVSTRRYAFADMDDENEDLLIEPFHILPFGVSIDPVNEFILYCVWPQVAENIVIDSQNYTDFDPKFAPLWLLRCKFEPQPICFLSECIAEYMQQIDTKKTLSELLGDGYTYNSGTMNFDGNPLDLLTESKISTLTSILPNMPSRNYDSKKVVATAKTDGPISEEHLMEMLYYMFPDAQPESVHPYAFADNEAFDPMKIKTAAPDSLIHRLSALLALCNSYFGGIKAMAQLWAEFTQEMRFRIERCIPIPGVANGFPDSRTCLLHQKLQMLNVCMERRSIREGGLPFSMTQKHVNRNQDESDDEFYDCNNDNGDEDSIDGKVKHAPWNRPEGRLSRLGDMRLVDSDEPLFVPITQEPVPKTEDQLEDDAEVMLKLGPGSELRAQMMSASLLSDMESFKAANPNGKLDDFIRWYSPRDWIEDDDTMIDESSEQPQHEPKQSSPSPSSSPHHLQQRGRLSSRMLIPGNTWQTVWEAAKPVPAKRQKRLFDDTKEAEKVMHFLESINIGQIVQLTIAALMHTAIIQIKNQITQNAACIIPNHIEMQDKLIATCCKLSRETWTVFPTLTPTQSPRGGSMMKNWDILLAAIMNIEYLIVKSQSLVKKLFEDSSTIKEEEKEFIYSLLNGLDSELKDISTNPIATRIVDLFSEVKRYQSEQSMEHREASMLNQSPLTNPVEKQFTLRLNGRTQYRGYIGPQFMRAILSQNEFRLCGAFSQDTTFV